MEFSFLTVKKFVINPFLVEKFQFFVGDLVLRSLTCLQKMVKKFDLEVTFPDFMSTGKKGIFL